MKTNNLLIFVSFIIVLTFSLNTHVFGQVKHDKFLIMIDPGHGGRDTGTPGTGRYKATEKDIALDVSLALGKMLKEKIDYVEVFYTRKTDVFPSLADRAIVANDEDVDLFISIHCNAQPGKQGTAYGSETFVLGTSKNKQNLEVAKRENGVIALEDNKEVYKEFKSNSAEFLLGLELAQEEYLDNSIKLARLIEDEIQTTANRRSRGVKQQIFYVLAYTYMPSVLVELGFLTHKKEEDFLNSKKGKNIMTKSLFNAVNKYLDYLGLENKTILNSKSEIKNTNNKIDDKEDIIFKVQIAASSKVIETKPFNFNGLDAISRLKVGSLYKYFYEATSNYTKIKKFEEEAKSKGYNSSFIVAFKDGKKIALDTALKSIQN